MKGASKSKKVKPSEPLLEEKLIFYNSEEKIVDFKTSLERYRDIKAMVDDLFDDFEREKLDYYSIC
jgi:hypothetical protein